MKQFGLVLLALLLTGGCGRNEQKNESGPLIGLAINTLNNPFFSTMKAAAERTAESTGVRIVVLAADREMDAERHIQLVENLIQRGVAAICITPNGAQTVVPAILKANRAGLPVVVVDSRVDETALRAAGGRMDCFVGSDNVEGGRLAGIALAERLGFRGKVAILEGPPGHETGESRQRGFQDAIAEKSDMQIVASQVASFDRSQGYQVCQNILTANPKLDGIFAVNDMMALGAVEAIAAAGRLDQIVVIGFDAIEEARTLIRTGRMHASVAQYPDDMGRIAVETAARLVRGEQVKPIVNSRIALITRENVDAP